MLKSTLHAGGGLEKYTLRLFKALQEKGHDVQILSTHSEYPATQICRRLNMSFLNLLWFDYNCRAYLKKHQYDVILGLDRHLLPQTHYRAGNGCHAAYLARRKKICSPIRNFFFSINPLHILTRLSEKKTFEAPSKTIIICNSHLVRQEILSFYPQTSPERVIVVHNGVEWGEYEPHFQQKLLAPRSHSSPPHILFVGHEWKRKGLDILLAALHLLKDQQFIVTAIGKEKNPSYFCQLAQKYGIANKVRLYPTAQNPIPFYQSANIAVLPSRYDPFANVTLEAMAMGLYVVTTTANGGAEAVTNYINGHVIDEDSSAQTLAQAILSAFSIVKDPVRPQLIRDSIRHYDLPLKLQQCISILENTPPSNTVKM
jgi:UDP-glucose:(heptosyl)LPS alpha-1,3-glucosyltransferase